MHMALNNKHSQRRAQYAEATERAEIHLHNASMSSGQEMQHTIPNQSRGNKLKEAH